MARCRALALEACHQVLDILLSIASEHERDPHVVLIARRASGTSPGGGLEIPFPHARIDPAYIGVPSTGRISTRTVLRRLAAVSRETGSQPPGSAPYLPLQSGGARRDYRIRCASQCTALDQHLPKQPYLPHSSISAQSLPSHRTRRTRRPTFNIHIAAASGSSSRATAHDGSTSGKESASIHQRHPAT